MVVCEPVDESLFRLLLVPCRPPPKADVNRIVFRVSKGLTVDVCL